MIDLTPRPASEPDEFHRKVRKLLVAIDEAAAERKRQSQTASKDPVRTGDLR